MNIFVANDTLTKLNIIKCNKGALYCKVQGITGGEHMSRLSLLEMHSGDERLVTQCCPVSLDTSNARVT